MGVLVLPWLSGGAEVEPRWRPSGRVRGGDGWPPWVAGRGFEELETRLYNSREAFASALAEYDEVCEQHHGEIKVIRAALFEKFGRIPVLDTYRQATIRAQKVLPRRRACSMSRRPRAGGAARGVSWWQ